MCNSSYKTLDEILKTIIVLFCFFEIQSFSMLLEILDCIINLFAAGGQWGQNKKICKKSRKMTETLAYGLPSDRTQQMNIKRTGFR